MTRHFRTLALAGFAACAFITPVLADPPQPKIVVINRSDILTIDRSAESPMPVGLLNSLNAEEVADLLAYLISGANPKDPMFAK
jgi:hypothetical protein